MHHGVEVLLQVDALAQAVGADQHAVLGGRLAELEDARLALRRRQQAGDALDLDVLEALALGQRRAQTVGHVVGGRDEAAEDDRPVALAQQRLDDVGGLGQLGVALEALELLGLARHVEELGALAAADVVVRVKSLPGATSMPSPASSSMRSKTLRRPTASASSAVSVSAPAARVRSVSAAAAGLDESEPSRASSDHQRTRWRCCDSPAPFCADSRA